MRIGTRGIRERLTRRRQWAAISAAWLGALSMVHAGAFEQGGSAPSTVAAGLKVYGDRKCATCHMIARNGNIRFPLDGVASRLSVTDLRRWLTDTGEMERALPRQPAVRMSEWLESNRTINERDREALVAYLASLK